jgi:hypothetical protein
MIEEGLDQIGSEEIKKAYTQASRNSCCDFGGFHKLA